MSNDVLEAALQAAGSGVQVLPAQYVVNQDGSISKFPWPRDWPNKGSTDKRQIHAWWRERPDSILAMPTGQASGYIVVDVDMKHGVDGMANLLNVGFDPFKDYRGAYARTPSGGFHFYYRAGDHRFKNSAGALTPGVDLRAERGCVILPPSPPPPGFSEPYRWEWANA